MRIQVLSVSFAIILASCMPATIPTPTESIPTAIVLTPTLIPTLTESNPVATALFTPTIIPISTATSTTVELQITDLIVFSMLSPDGTKIIQTKDWVTFDILNTKDEKIIWSFTYDQTKFSEDGYLTEGSYQPFYWSQNGKYIYVKARQGLDGGVKYWGNVFGAVQGLARFDVDKGVMIEILNEKHWAGYTFAISPDESSIVYVDQWGTPLVLRWRGLLTDKEKTLITFEEQIYDVGAFGWSPKTDKLIFTTLEIPNPDQQRPEWLFDFFVLDLENPQLRMVFQGFDKWLHFVSWNKQNQVFYTDSDNTVWQLDLVSKTLSAKATATPIP